MTEKIYDIQELVSQSGVPRRTIYFYVQQGILPPPEGAGLAAHYSEDHLLRLRLIPLLRQQGLRLDEIRARFAQMNSEEMRSFLNTNQLARSAPPGAPRAIREAPGIPDIPEFPGQPAGWGEQRYLHYALPAGIALVAPEALGMTDRQKLQQLLHAARQIFSGLPYYYAQAGQRPDSGPNFKKTTRDATAQSNGENKSPEEE